MCVEEKSAKYQRWVSKKRGPNIRGVCRRKECQISEVCVEEKSAKYQRWVSKEKSAKYQRCVWKNALKTCGPGSRQFELEPDQPFVPAFVTRGLYRPDPILFRLGFNFDGRPEFLR